MNLAELIKSHKGTRSFADLERDCGGSPKAARIQQLATGTLKNFPDPPTIKALARGLRIPEVTVVLSSAESLGIDARRAAPSLLDRLPAGVDRLSEEQIASIAGFVHTLVVANEQLITRDRIVELLLAESPDEVQVEKNGAPLEGSEREEALRTFAAKLADTNSGLAEKIAAARAAAQAKEDGDVAPAAKKSVSKPGQTRKQDDYVQAAREELSTGRALRREHEKIGTESQVDPNADDGGA